MLKDSFCIVLVFRYDSEKRAALGQIESVKEVKCCTRTEQMWRHYWKIIINKMRTDYSRCNRKMWGTRYGDEKDIAAEPPDTLKIIKLCLKDVFTFFQGG